MQTKHQIDWDSARRITYSTDYYQQLTLESWFTNLEQTPLNRSQQSTVSGTVQTTYCSFARDVTAAMLVVKNKSISLLWELNSIFM